MANPYERMLGREANVLLLWGFVLLVFLFCFSIFDIFSRYAVAYWRIGSYACGKVIVISKIVSTTFVRRMNHYKFKCVTG